MNIKLKADGQSVIIEKWDIEYPYSLNIHSIFPRKCIWTDKIITSAGSENISDSIGFKFYIRVRRKLDIEEIKEKTLDKYPMLKKNDDDLLWHGIDTINPNFHHPLWLKKKETWIQSGANRRTRPAVFEEHANQAKQQCLFEDILFAQVIYNNRWDNIVIIPLIETVPDFFFKNLNDAKETIDFTWEYSDIKTKTYGKNPKKEVLDFFMKIEYK